MKTLADIFRANISEVGNQSVIHLLGQQTERCETFKEIDIQARRIAGHLQQHCARGETVLLMYPTGLEIIPAILGCFYAGMIAVPVAPPRARRRANHLESIASDAGTKTVLTIGDKIKSYRRRLPAEGPLASHRWVASEQLPPDLMDDWKPIDVASDDVALLQYTSGSTASSKGVMVTHANLLANLDLICSTFGHHRDSVGVIWLPSHHDMGLVGGILQPLFVGCPVVLMSPESVIQRPLRWLQAISRYGATTSGGPNFIYDRCVETIQPDDCAGLDLNCWEVAFNGAEPLRADSLERFAEKFAPFGFRREALRPCYGLAEATLLVTCGQRGSQFKVFDASKQRLAENGVMSRALARADTTRLVGCGEATGDWEVVIVEPNSQQRCERGKIGEIWLAGECVAKGYWRNPELTKELFKVRLADGNCEFLRTGDLGCIIDGELYVTGRCKDLIIFDGRNHYPQDIERTVESSHGALSSSAAFSLDDGGREQLVIAAELSRGGRDANFDDVLEAVRRSVFEEHGLAVASILLLPIGELPRTTSGKTQRQLCRERLLRRRLKLSKEWYLPKFEAPWREQLQSPDEPKELSERVVVTGQDSKADADRIRGWLCQRVADQLQCAADEVDIHKPLANFGLASRDSVEISRQLEELTGRDLSATLVYQYPTIASLVDYLTSTTETRPQTSSDGERRPSNEPIAIVGIGCRFPGAHGPQEFWQLLTEGRDAIRKVPPDRWDSETVDKALSESGVETGVSWGGFLDQIDEFDAQFFEVSDREAAFIDPQQRLLLETSWEAIEDAGISIESLRGSDTGVFVGVSTSDYGTHFVRRGAELEPYWSAGNAHSIAANRLSYFFDLCGPSLAVDTACSSSLVAVHLACQSLIDEDCDLAVAGGVNVILSPDISISFSKAGGLANDGRCKPFDSRADGIVRSEGVGVVVLKRLSKALQDGDHVYAVVRGGSVNQDGRTNGLTAPSQASQEAVIRGALRCADVSPRDIQYVETHGAGSFLGDVIEIEALRNVFSAERSQNGRRVLGALKSNIGHCEAAAGVAGFIKLALAIEHCRIPPNLHFVKPNPKLELGHDLFEFPTSLKNWDVPAGRRLGGISSFGFGGTNAHLILESAPSFPRTSEGKLQHDRTQHLLPLSASAPDALHALCEILEDQLLENGPFAEVDLNSLTHAASVRRSHLRHRAAFQFSDREQLRHELHLFRKGESQPSVSAGRVPAGEQPKLVFVFSGQGGQWAGMGRTLMEHSEPFRTALEHCDKLVNDLLGWSLLADLAEASRPNNNSLVAQQVTLFSLQLALASLWQDWGIIPDAVVGHSMGEITAACISGALSVEDGMKIITTRSQLMQKLAESSSETGAMATLRMSTSRAKDLLDPYEGRIEIAVSNSPKHTVLSGDADALAELVERCRKEYRIAGRMMNVAGAGHCWLVEPARIQLEQCLSDLKPRSAKIPFYSSVNEDICPGTDLDGSYWGRNLREPVGFLGAVNRLIDDRFGTWLEMSPHPVLSSAIIQTLNHRQHDGIVVASMRRDQDEMSQALRTLGSLYVEGRDVSWSRVNPADDSSIRLPSYPFQRRRCWIDAQAQSTPGMNMAWASAHAGSPLLGNRIDVAHGQPNTVWRAEIDSRTISSLADHRVQGRVVVPLAGYLEAVSEATKDLFNASSHVLEDISILNTLVLSDDSKRELQLTLHAAATGRHRFQIHSRSLPSGQKASWVLHAEGGVRLAEPATHEPLHQTAGLDEVRAACTVPVDCTEHYKRLEACGAQYGPAFRGLRQAWCGHREALGQVVLPEQIAAEIKRHEIHPAIIDASFHVLAVAVGGERLPDENALFLPVGVREWIWHGGHQDVSVVWSHARLPNTNVDDDVIEGDVTIWDEAENEVLSVRGLQFRRVVTDVTRDKKVDTDQWYYQVQWRESTITEAPDGGLQSGLWLLLDDEQGIAEELQGLLQEIGQDTLLAKSRLQIPSSAGGSLVVNPTDVNGFDRLLQHIAQMNARPICGVVNLWALTDSDGLPSRERLTKVERQLAGTIHLVQALERFHFDHGVGLWLVTQNVHSIAAETTRTAPCEAALWGLGRVIQREQPGLRCKLIDLDGRPAKQAASALLHDLLSTSTENEIALREQHRLVARLTRWIPVAPEACHEPGTSESSTLTTDHPSVTETLPAAAASRRPPRDHEVEIRVLAAGLNFQDMPPDLRAPDNSIGYAFVGECAGEVVRIGKEVKGCQVGDPVVTLARDAFSRYLTTPAIRVVPKPAELSMDEAAAIPTAFLAAFYALIELGRLAAGERVLIHTAAGGVGLAAIELAIRHGAEVFATAGSESSRHLLRHLGVNHVLDSANDYVNEIKEITAGEGVDVVVNSISGAGVTKSLSILRPMGRFVELGKQDFYEGAQLDLRPFASGLSYLAVDIGSLVESHGERVTPLLKRLINDCANGELKRLPTTIYPASNVAEASRVMAQAGGIGKIVFKFDADATNAPRFCADATYLIAGGLGGLGLTVCRWMVQHGARHIVLTGRQAPSEAAQDTIELMREQGARIFVRSVDIRNPDEVSDLIREVHRSMPQLRGVIHSAGALDDSLLTEMKAQQLREVMSPKTHGAWNLHEFTVADPLDFFVCFSSVASVLGSPGQGNYAAGNAFLDGLASYRRSQGLPAVAINWGPWSQVGGAARAGLERRLNARGFGSIAPELGTEVLGKLLHEDISNVVVMPVNWATSRRAFRRAIEDVPLLSEILSEHDESEESGTLQDGQIRAKLNQSLPEARIDILTDYLRELIANTLGTSKNRVDVQLPLSHMGIDSLMALEMKNRAELELSIEIPIIDLLEGPTIAKLATLLLARMESSSASSPESTSQSGDDASGSPPIDAKSLVGQLDELSDEDVEHLYRQMLAEEKDSGC